MDIRNPLDSVYSTQLVIEKTWFIEKEYGVSIKWWLNLLGTSDGHYEMALHFGISGPIADDLPEDRLQRRFIVYNQEPYAVGEALRYSLVYIEKVLSAQKYSPDR